MIKETISDWLQIELSELERTSNIRSLVLQCDLKDEIFKEAKQKEIFQAQKDV